MANKEFATFILTYGRAEKVHTYDTLNKYNYTGDLYFVCSDDDKQVDRYKKIYKDKVLQIQDEL